MKKDKSYHVVWNLGLIPYGAVLLLCMGGVVLCAIEQAIFMMILMIGFALLAALILLTSPWYFVFSEECLRIVYHFGQKEIIPWEDIKAIRKKGRWLGFGGGFPHYEIDYPKNEKRMFFVYGEIPKTGKTQKLVQRYYKRELK